MGFFEIYIIIFVINIIIMKLLVLIGPKIIDSSDTDIIIGGDDDALTMPIVVNFIPGFNFILLLINGFILISILFFILCACIGKFIGGKDFEL